MSKTEENVSNVRALVKYDRRLTVRMISSALNLNHQTIYDIMTEELGMRTLGCCMTTTLPVNTAISMKEVLTKKVTPVVPKPPYLPDLNPCDFFLFLKLKFHLKGHHIETVDNIQKVMKDQPKALPHKDFQHCYQEWEQLLWQCVPSQENYFEVDDVDF
jgi:hypothetical protein